jgi:hypothetical protein
MSAVGAPDDGIQPGKNEPGDAERDGSHDRGREVHPSPRSDVTFLAIGADAARAFTRTASTNPALALR